MGFIIEYIDPEAVLVSDGGTKQGCLAALRSMHERGIAHGDAQGGIVWCVGMAVVC